MIFLTPMMTQSVGVPFKAKWRGPISRKRSGSLRESEGATPDWSLSGATTVTSSDSSPAIDSRSLSPAAWMPSSLVRRIRMGPVFARGVRGGERVLAGKGESRCVHALLRQRPELWPAVRTPDDGRKLKLGCAGAVAVVIMIGEPIALGGFQRLLPAGADKAASRRQHQRAATLQHRLAVFVPVRTLDPVGSADANVVGRGDALAALVEADEEEELAIVLEDRGSFDRAPVATGERDARRIRADELAGFRVELAQLDAGPERAEGEEGAPVRRIDAEGVDGVEVVAIPRHQSETLILPAIAGLERIERRVGHEPDGARVVAEARQAIIEQDRISAPADRGRPDIGRPEAQRHPRPRRRSLPDQARVRPSDPIRRGFYADGPVRGSLLSRADSDKLAADLDHRGVVDLHITDHLRLRLGRPDGRRQEKREREHERPARSFSPHWSHRGFSCNAREQGHRLQPQRLRR